MKLKHHKRQSRKISEEVSKLRKSKGGKSSDFPLIRYRVEIWREPEGENPEVRLAHFPLQYRRKEYRSQDVLQQITQSVFDWMERTLPPDDRSIWDTPLERVRLEALFARPNPKYEGTDDDIAF